MSDDKGRNIERTYGKIVKKKHFERLLGLLNQEKTLHGVGLARKKLKIEPALMFDVKTTDAVMKKCKSSS